MLIVGTGISGSVLAYEAENLGLNYLVLTSEKSALANTSALSNAHCRVPDKKNIEECVRLSVEKFGDSEECVRYIYENAELVNELYRNLRLDYEKRSFGVIPNANGVKAGCLVIKKLQERLRNISVESKLVDLFKEGEGYSALLRIGREYHSVKANRVIFATGGFAGMFRSTDCYKYRDYNSYGIAVSNGAKLKNLENIFFHPFGYNNGRRILTGKESSKGEFLREDGSLFFNEELRARIKEDNYHERMSEIRRIIEDEKDRGGRVLFRTEGKEFDINPSAHYTAGGIETDKYGMVLGCENMYAIGECRADGSKNGGRLPGYAFTSAIVHGLTLARRFAGKI